MAINANRPARVVKLGADVVAAKIDLPSIPQPEQ